MDIATSPSSSPTSVAIHQESLRQRSPPEDPAPIVGGKFNGVSTTRRDLSLVEDAESSDCSTSNPQQGTTIASTHSAASSSSEIEGMRTIDERPSSRCASRNSSSQRPGGSGGTTRGNVHQHGKQETLRQKRPPRLIDTRPNMKIPPTHKDNRKLFVGGLPLDGTFLRL
jgi:hypothetical protein